MCMYFRSVLWKCYKNIFDGLKSRVMKVDEEGLEEKGRKKTKERQKEERERERERETACEKNVYTCRT